MARLLDCASAGEPCRIIIPKARKLGVSTFVQALFYFLSTLIDRRRAVTYAQTTIDTRTLFGIAKRIDEGARGKSGPESSTAIDFDNGSRYECRTAGGRGVSRGDTIHYLHLSELASLQSVSGMDAEAVVALLNAVADQPHTIIFIESTGSGPVGEFYRRCMDARDGVGSYHLEFHPWYEDASYTCPVEGPGLTLDAEEAGMVRRHDLTHGQILWRRRKRADHPNESQFRREYPTVLGDCFSAASGRVYPQFDARLLEEGGHVGSIEVDSAWLRYRAIDWGATENHPFVCLWMAVDHDGQPGIIINPDLRDMISEFGAYVRDELTGKPKKDHDHAMDCLRMAVATFDIRGTVYCYRLYYDRNPPPPDGVARTIHEMSGWEMPVDAPFSDISAYRRGIKGEVYEGTVCDRARKDSPKMFESWGIDPLTRHRAPSLKTPGRGEVEDGIAIVQTLLSGRTRFHPKISNPATELHVKMRRSRRRLMLSPDERHILRREHRDIEREVAEYDQEDETFGFW